MLTATDKHTAAFNALGQTFPKQMPRVSRIKDFYIIQAHCAWLFCSSLHEAFVEMLRKTKLFSYYVGFQMLEFICW